MKPEPPLALTLFDTRPLVGDKPLHPMTGGRIALLEERANPLVIGGQPGAEISSWKLFEVLLVATSTDEELVELSFLEAGEWDRAVRRLGLATTTEELLAFSALLENELVAIQAATPKKKTAMRKRATR